MKYYKGYKGVWRVNSVIVIGAGIGGLTTAARLARAGYKVTLLEKNSRPGGRTDKIEGDGFQFDTGPTLFLMPGLSLPPLPTPSS